jgi:hypothetical protein
VTAAERSSDTLSASDREINSRAQNRGGHSAS